MEAAQTSRAQRQLANEVSRELGRAGPSSDVADNHLIQRSLEGDLDAFGALVTRYERRAFWIGFHILGEVEESRDVVQEAFVRVYRSLDRFDFARSFYTWLYRIVTNLAIDKKRQLRLRHTTPLEDPTGAPPEDIRANPPSEQLDTKERAALVRRVIDGLPDMLRTVLVLKDLEGLSCREIAPVTGLTYSTVRWRLHRARRLFRERWERVGR
jgi:RNA polymerase sigma-70 factor (ECF subfamily)